MEVVNKSSALLSNHEVLTLLSEMEAEQLAKARSHLAAKKEEEAAVITGTSVPPVAGNPTHDEVPQNLRTVEIELIAHLRDQYPLMQRQHDVAIQNLTRGLGETSLTKSEKLQIVNLAPRQLVELYVIVENLEDRFTDDEINKILSLVEQSLLTKPLTSARRSASVANRKTAQIPSTQAGEAWSEAEAEAEEGMENYLVHETAGGVDDLEMDDEEE